MSETKLTLSTFPWDLGGDGVVQTAKTIDQDAGRIIDLAFLTVMTQKQSDGKLDALTDVNPTLTSASLACGVNGGLIAAYQNADSEFAITIDGTLTNIQVDMTAIVALTDIAPAINTISIPLGVICSYNEETNTFYFSSLKQGLPASTITVLTAVAGGAGTDISGATHLNGLTAVGTVTAATGEVTASIPAGLFMGDDIAFADIVAGDVTNQHLLIGGNKYIDEDMIILENSLTLASVVTATGKTVRQHLEELDIFPTPSDNHQQIQPI